MAEGGCGGNSAIPLQKIEASPAALLVKAKHHRKILFSLREKEIRRAQNEKSKEYFSVVRRAVASGGGTASLVPFKVGSREVYNYSTKTNFVGNEVKAPNRLFLKELNNFVILLPNGRFGKITLIKLWKFSHLSNSYSFKFSVW